MIKTPKIISVGNISLGGTGKTPFTIKLTNHFLTQGMKVCILSRGYRGKIGLGTNVISDGENILIKPPLAADEPYMIAESCKGAVVITGKERKESAAFAIEHFKPDLFILDDGFQHKRMGRDLDIVLLDHKNPISTGFPFPFGYLREFPSALQRAGIIVFTRATDCNIPEKAAKYVQGKPVFFSNIEFKGIRTAGGLLHKEEIKGTRALTFAGIAGSGRFFNFLAKNEIDVASSRHFRDHKDYDINTLDKLEETAKRKDLDLIITTQKDFVKIPDERKSRYAYAEIDIVINEEKAFFEEVNKIFS